MTHQPDSRSNFVSAEQLQALIGDPRLVLLDVRYHPRHGNYRDNYRQGHISGAIFVDFETDIAGPTGPGLGRFPLPPPETIGETLRSWGISEDSLVVVYSETTPASASRAILALRSAGLANVWQLNGGLEAWKAHGGKVTTDIPAPPRPGNFVAKPGAVRLVDADRAWSHAQNGSLLDARPPESFRGVTDGPNPERKGHIPGARSLPTLSVLDQQGRLRPRDEILAELEIRGIPAGSEVGVYCGSGIGAAHLWLVFREVGIDAEVYLPSWAAWSEDSNRPVATGDQ